MAPKGIGKTKEQELQRIRDNQQRSRDRKRAYITELEENVRQLSEKLQRCEPCGAPSTGASTIAQENDARRELLKALGIDEAAQQQFVRAFMKRSEVQQLVTGLPHGEAGCAVEQDIALAKSENAAFGDSPAGTSASWATQQQCSNQPQGGCSQNREALDKTPRVSPDSGFVSACDSPAKPLGAVGAPETQALAMRATSISTLPLAAQNFDSHAPSLQSMSLEQQAQALWTPCLWSANMQTNASCSESTTGCGIAFSMLLSNNSRGYTFSDIEARLQAAYRRDDTVAEGCSVVNRVLFQLLSEIS